MRTKGDGSVNIGTTARGSGSTTTTVDVRVKNPKLVNGRKKLVTTVKSHISGNVQETTLKRTIDGKHAALQLKLIIHPHGRIEYVHIHCMKDKQSSNWGRTSGRPIGKFYDILQNNDSQIIRCKICKNAWSSSGRVSSRRLRLAS